jgi:hypothetical protein
MRYMMCDQDNWVEDHDEFFQLYENNNGETFIWDAPVMCEEGYFLYSIRIAYYYSFWAVDDDIGMYWL